ncbi:hypothetical protein [Alteribacillus bidgolensis]|uniref:Uncharacterized protein n=1 Tax=Alteribacillus bidgolensis TaxID=930129 RepID=A0A1G8N157_9BACI|nr:hypothetical protein [Alteribacillus bidgolensis]SDI73979.1 hypothetical protein SAMN05216352_11164 [Alteribacillus bidgolensis]
MLTQIVKNGLFGIAEHMSDDSIDDLDGDDFYELPKYLASLAAKITCKQKNTSAAVLLTLTGAEVAFPS